MEGNASGTFPVEEGSGYRVFVNWVSETPSEKFKIAGRAAGRTVSVNPDPDDDVFFSDLYFNDPDYFNNTVTYSTKTSYLDVRARASGIELIFDTDRYNRPRGIIPDRDGDFEGFPLTPRILSISGCPLEITSYVVVIVAGVRS